MVGVVNDSDDSSGSGSNNSTLPDPGSSSSSRKPTWRLPSVKLLKLPEGKYSPLPDERCFIYCSQSARGRATGQEPWCRSICFRKVFAYEVADKDSSPSRVSSSSSTSSQATAAAASSSSATIPPQGKHPLPVEGQIQFRPSTLDPTRPTGPKYWEQGWYIWMSRNRWATQEKIDLMMLDLDKQTDWIKRKARLKRDWEEKLREGREKDANVIGNGKDRTEQAQVADVQQSANNEDRTATQDRNQNSRRPRPSRLPEFMTSDNESFLIKLPPPMTPLTDPFKEMMAPTVKAYGIFQQSIRSGALRDFAGQVQDTAWTDKPYQLLQQTWQHVWNSIWNNGGGGGGTSDGSGKA